MRIRDIVVIFLSLFIMLAGLAIPLWWAFAVPVMSQIIGHESSSRMTICFIAMFTETIV